MGIARGFTLLELALVTAVMAVLLVAALPRFQSTAERLRLEHQAFELVQLARYARERATTQSREVVWEWSSAGRQARLAVIDDQGNATTLQERLARTGSIEPPTSVRILDARGGSIECDCARFFPDGTADPVTVVVSRNALTYRIAIDGTTGQPTLAAGLPPR